MLRRSGSGSVRSRMVRICIGVYEWTSAETIAFLDRAKLSLVVPAKAGTYFDLQVCAEIKMDYSPLLRAAPSGHSPCGECSLRHPASAVRLSPE